MTESIKKKEYIKPSKDEKKEWKQNLYNSLVFLTSERPEFYPKKKDSLETLLESFFTWADDFNDGYFSEQDDAETDRYSAWLVQEHILNNDWDEFIRLYDSPYSREIEKGMISFECPIYLDTLSLLISGKTDILNEVKCQIMQGDPCIDNIKDEMLEKLEDKVYTDNERIDAEKLENMWDCDTDIETIMKYVTYNEDGIEFDYGEADACDDRRLGVYRIPCTFNSAEFIKENYPWENE